MLDNIGKAGIPKRPETLVVSHVLLNLKSTGGSTQPSY